MEGAEPQDNSLVPSPSTQPVPSSESPMYSAFTAQDLRQREGKAFAAAWGSPTPKEHKHLTNCRCPVCRPFEVNRAASGQPSSKVQANLLSPCMRIDDESDLQKRRHRESEAVIEFRELDKTAAGVNTRATAL